MSCSTSSKVLEDLTSEITLTCDPKDNQMPFGSRKSNSLSTAEFRMSESTGVTWQSRRGVLFATIVACLGSFSYGTVLGYASTVVTSINDQPNPFHLNSVEDITWFASIVGLGQSLSSVCAGPLLNIFGRKTVIIVIAAPLVIGWVLIAASFSFPFAMVGRFITTLCSGMLDVAVPLYVVEVSPADIRGCLGSCDVIFTYIGMIFTFGIGSMLKFNWHAIVCAFFPTIMMILMCFMPETPRWLMDHGYREGTVEVLHFLRGKRADINAEFEELLQNIQASSGSVTWKDFINPTVYKPFFIVFTAILIQQLSGVSIVDQYTVTIFVNAGCHLNPYICNVIVCVAGLLSSILSAVLTDRTGRRVLLVVSCVIMSVSMGAMGAFFIIKEKYPHFAMNSIFWLPVVSFIVYNFGLGIGFKPVVCYMGCELFPLKTRGIAYGISSSIRCLLYFIVSKYLFLLSIFVREYGVYWIMSGVSTLGIIFVLVAVPETRSKSLEKIENDFKK